MMYLAVTVDNCTLVFIQLDRNLAIVQSERVAKGNQFMRALCRHHARDDGRREHRPFGGLDVTAGKTAGDIGRELDQGPRMRGAIGRLLVADIPWSAGCPRRYG
jgi:hypothetical protein